MKRTSANKTLGLVFTLVPILLGALTGNVQAQWTRLALDEGGVGEDVQVLRLSDNSLGEVVWSANMEGGLFRAEYGDPNGWGGWTEYLPGRGMFGVEAIQAGGNEHVLAATGIMGVWYKENPTAGGTWPRPNQNLGYPDAWEHVWTHDVAFFRNTNDTWPDTPQDSFFVILVDTVELGQYDQNPGIYRWDATLQTPNFARVDAQNNWSDSRGFAHFWRDLEDGNVLYVTSPDGVYKLSGSYTSPKFEKLPPEIKFDDLPISRPPAGLPSLPRH